jgi:hypothetical protein
MGEALAKRGHHQLHSNDWIGTHCGLLVQVLEEPISVFSTRLGGYEFVDQNVLLPSNQSWGRCERCQQEVSVDSDCTMAAETACVLVRGYREQHSGVCGYTHTMPTVFCTQGISGENDNEDDVYE